MGAGGSGGVAVPVAPAAPASATPARRPSRRGARCARLHDDQLHPRGTRPAQPMDAAGSRDGGPTAVRGALRVLPGKRRTCTRRRSGGVLLRDRPPRAPAGSVQGAANGPCVNQDDRGCQDDKSVVTSRQRFISPTFPVGRAVNLMACQGSLLPNRMRASVSARIRRTFSGIALPTSSSTQSTTLQRDQEAGPRWCPKTGTESLQAASSATAISAGDGISIRRSASVPLRRCRSLVHRHPLRAKSHENSGGRGAAQKGTGRSSPFRGR